MSNSHHKDWQSAGFLISNNQYPISNDQVCYPHLDIDYSLLDIGYSPFPLYPLKVLPSCGGSPFTKFFFTGSVLGHVFLKDIAPNGLKGSTAAVQGVHLGKIRMLAAQIAPFNPVRGYPGIGWFRLSIYTLFHSAFFLQPCDQPG